MASDLGRRLTVAAIGIPLTVAVTLAGGWLFAAGLALLATVAVWEIGRMLEVRGDLFLYVPAMAFAALLPLAALQLSGWGMWGITMAAVVTVAGVATLRIAPEERPFQTAALTLAAALYVGGLISFGVPLRELFSSGAVEGTPDPRSRLPYQPARSRRRAGRNTTFPPRLQMKTALAAERRS